MHVCVFGGVGGGRGVEGMASFTGADCGVCAQTRPEITEQIAQLASSPLSTHKQSHTYIHMYTHTHTNVERDKQILTKY